MQPFVRIDECAKCLQSVVSDNSISCEKEADNGEKLDASYGHKFT